MKKYLLFFIILISIPVFAICSIDSNESLCSLQQNSMTSTPLFQNQNNGIKSGINLNSNGSINNPPLQPSSINNSFGQQNDGIQMQGSLSCEFGNCNKGVNNTFLRNE